MCDLKNTQILSQIETQPMGNTNDVSLNEDEIIWGCLYPIGSAFKPVYLKKDVHSFGRRADCDVSLATIENSLCAVSAYSNLHFTIKREFTGRSGQHALLEDSSSNGTFVNGEKIGKGRVQALKNNSEISLCLKDNKAYIFIDKSSKDDENYPLEIREKYTITKLLGVGAYGEVRLAFEKYNCNKYAIKIIQKKKFSINGRHQINGNTQIMSEINILKKLQHPCMIKIYEVIDTPDSVFIVLDLVEGGELFDKVVSIGNYPESTAKLLFYQMVLAIKYLHDHDICHRDLKPENILLAEPNTNETLIKITDFGLSKFFDATSMMKTFCGTPNYLAPEVLTTKGEGLYTKKIDNWSLGVILYIILVGFPPFSDENLEQQIKAGRYDFTDEAWTKVSDDAKHVIKRLMCVEPTNRASLEEILDHQWISSDSAMKQIAHKLMKIDEARTNSNDLKRTLDSSFSSESENFEVVKTASIESNFQNNVFLKKKK